MVASSESTTWQPHLDNGVEHKLAPPTTPATTLPASNATNFAPGTQPRLPATSPMKGLTDEAAVFAVPAVPKKANRRISAVAALPAALTNKSSKKSSSRTKNHAKNSTIPREPLKEVADDSDQNSPQRKKQRLTQEPGEETVAKMLVSIAGLLRRRNAEKLADLQRRYARLNTLHVNYGSENTLKAATSSFHDFLNGESYKPEAKVSLVPGGEREKPGGTLRRNTSGKEQDGVLLTSRASEQKSMQELFGVLSVTKDDMKNKTPMQLVEFVKRVESNQRREAFEKQQRPAYLLKLAKTQSANRSATYIATAQHLHRAIDRVNSDDPYLTDSSSGGESVDEAENEGFNEIVDMDRMIPIQDRALHRYGAARHAISTRYQYAYRQLARMEYGYQVVGNLLQRLQQKQGVPIFGDGSVEDVRSPIKSAAVMHKDRSSGPRTWDDREVTTAGKTSNCTTFLRLPTAKSNTGLSLHPTQDSFHKKKMKVVAPNFGLNYPFEMYEATMWKERLAFGQVLLDDGSDSEEVDDVEEEAKEAREFTEAVVSSARGCARARPLMCFKKRLVIPMNSFPPKRLQLDEKPRRCDCYSRSVLPDAMGPASCATCMGQLPLATWSSRTAHLRTLRPESFAQMDHGYHARLSQPCNRALDVELSGVSVDFDPAKLHGLTAPIKPRPTQRVKSQATVKAEADLLRTLQKQEEELRREKERLFAIKYGNFADDLAHSKRSRIKATPTGRPRGQRHAANKARSRKRRHSSLSSNTTTCSEVSSLTRSASIVSAENVQTARKRPADRTNPTANHTARRRRDAAHGDRESFVIPYGMTAPSKIEKIQYKEIIVPKFRDLKIAPTAAAVLTNGVCERPAETSNRILPADPVDSDDSSSEDLSDGVFSERHVKCEVEERTRFNIPEKSARKKNALANASHKKIPPESPVEVPDTIVLPEVESDVVIPAPKVAVKGASHKAREKKGKQKKNNHSTVISQDKPKKSRPRKTVQEMQTLYQARDPRPVRTRRSTFRASPDGQNDSYYS